MPEKDKEKITLIPEVQAEKELPIKSAEEMLVEEFEKISGAGTRKRKLIKIMLIGGVGILSLIILAIAGVVFKLDSYLFPSSVFGFITDFSNRPLVDVNVCIQSSCVTTDNEGYYEITGLKYGPYDLIAEKERFHKLQEQINVARGLNEVNRSLKPFGFGEIKGIFKAGSDLILNDMVLTIDAEPVLIASDGSFIIEEKMIGEYVLVLTSPFYQDFEITIDLKEGLKDLGEVMLIPSSDISFHVTDFISAVNLKGVKVQINDQEIESDDNGAVLFKDLEIAETYEYLASLEGYNSQTAKLTNVAAPDKLAIVELKMVRTGKVVYTSNRTGNYNVYAADYDGSNEKLLSDNKGNNTNPELSLDGNSVMFLSTRDGFKDAYNQPIAVVYRVNIDGTGLTKITKTQYEDLGSLGVYNFQAGKRAYTKYNYDAGGEQQVYFGNIDGTDMQMIFSNLGFDGYIRNLMIAPNGAFLIVDLIDSKEGSPLCYLSRINTQTGARNDILSLSAFSFASLISISPDSSSFLLITSGLDDNNENIFRIGINDGKVTKITNNSIAELTAYYSPDQSQIYYYDVRDNKTDVFKTSAQGGSEVRLTTAGKVEQVIGMRGPLLFFIENGKLMVLDSNYPGIARLVTENVSVYFSEWY